MRRGLATVVFVVVPCLAAGACISGDVWREYGIVNACGAPLEVTFDSTGSYLEHSHHDPDAAAIIPDGGEGSIGMLSGHTLTVVARQPGGEWAAAGEVTSTQLKAGGPLTISGELCPAAGSDPRLPEPLLGTYRFVEDADSVTWLSYAESEDDTPATEGPVVQRVAVLATGDQEWFDELVARGDDWREADLPGLPDVIVADLPPGTWEESRSVGPELRGPGSTQSVQVFVNRDARAVLLRAAP